MIKIKRKCIKCGKVGFSKIHIHHITYTPEEKVFLCHKCHGYISSIDSIARQYYRKRYDEKIFRNSYLDNAIRKYMFKPFLKLKYNELDRKQRRSFAKRQTDAFFSVF